MEKPIVFMFSGQGSHYYHMGRELYKNNALFRKKIDQFDSIASDIFGTSIISKVYDDSKKKGDLFDETIVTSASILMLECAMAGVLIDNGVIPNFNLGASLGEVAALCVSEVESLDTILNNTKKILTLFETHCDKGRMIGILESKDLFYRTPLLSNNSEIAAINYDNHFVITCNQNSLEIIENDLRANQIVFQDLQVSQAFHSSMLDSAKAKFEEILCGFNRKAPQYSIISCEKMGEITSFDQNYLWNVFRNPIMFQKTIQFMETKHPCRYIDLGPSGTLANFTKYNLSKNSNSDVYSILTPFDRDLSNLEQVIRALSNSKPKREKKAIPMTNKLNAFVFPGQGSQAKGMGGDLFDEFSDITKSADRILGYSIKELCLVDPKKQLNSTQYTQPALYVVNALSYLKRINGDNISADFVAGHSLGEYSALFAAGAVDFETGLILVKKRGELMGLASGGAMAAVIGLDESKIQHLLTENNLVQIDIANLNTPTQIVISGQKEDIANAQPIFKKAGGHYIPLNVSAAFHSRYMQKAKVEFEIFLKDFEFSELKIPLIANVNARPYQQAEIKSNLANQLRSSVRWTESIRYLMGKGEMQFQEVGHGTILTKMIEKIQKEATPLVVDDEPEQLVVAPKSTSPDSNTGVTQQTPQIESAPAPVDHQNDSKAKHDLQNPISSVKDDNPPIHKSVKQMTDSTQFSPITASSLGNDDFKRTYNLKYAYVTGAMVRGIASKDLVIRMAKAGMLSFFGSGGLSLSELEAEIVNIQKELNNGLPYGFNLLNSPLENETVNLFLKYGVKLAEAAAYMQITPALTKYRLKGIRRDPNGNVIAPNRIMAKVSRPEVATAFLSPAPSSIITRLLSEGAITQEEAELAPHIPMADELCVEADSGGHTDGGNAYALMPAMLKLRDEMKSIHKYAQHIRVGAAGGIGTPEAAAAAFILGADFILTGSINQCTVEAGMSDVVKDLLQEINVQDTEYAPAGDMFEMGARVQVLKKGVFFPARANKLYDLYRQFNSIDEIDEKTKKQLQDRYFKRSFEDVYKDVKAYWPPEIIVQAEKNPKQKMALIFRWYFGYSTRIALTGEAEQRVDFQVHCGPSLGAFNQWVKDTELQSWRNRHVDQIAEKLMIGTAEILNRRFQEFVGNAKLN